MYYKVDLYPSESITLQDQFDNLVYKIMSALDNEKYDPDNAIMINTESQHIYSHKGYPISLMQRRDELNKCEYLQFIIFYKPGDFDNEESLYNKLMEYIFHDHKMDKSTEIVERGHIVYSFKFSNINKNLDQIKNLMDFVMGGIEIAILPKIKILSSGCTIYDNHPFYVINIAFNFNDENNSSDKNESSEDIQYNISHLNAMILHIITAELAFFDITLNNDNRILNKDTTIRTFYKQFPDNEYCNNKFSEYLAMFEKDINSIISYMT